MSDADRKNNKLQPIVILLYAPIVLTIFIYYGSAKFCGANLIPGNGLMCQYYYFTSSFVLLGLIPILIWIFGFKRSLIDLGLGLGNSKKSLFFASVGLIIMAVLSFLSSKNPAFQNEYPLFRGLIDNQSNLIGYIFMYGLYYAGWEIFFRGFMLFGLKERFGETYSILIQTIPSCLIHIGKPDAEIFSSIIAGLVFGWVTFRCRSIWPALISHWALGVLLDLFIIFR
jgi:membrane protease YdiL (CAAX protease family)